MFPALMHTVVLETVVLRAIADQLVDFSGRTFVRLVTAGLERLFALAFEFSLWFQVLGLLTITDNSIPLLDKEDIISINSYGIKGLDGEPVHSHHLLLTSPLLAFSCVLL